MQALDAALERIIVVDLAEIGPIYSILNDSIFLYDNLRGLLVLFQSVVYVGMEGHLALFSFHYHWSRELLQSLLLFLSLFQNRAVSGL